MEHNGHKCCSLAEASAQSRQELEALTFKAKASAAQLKEAEERVITIVNDLDRKKKREEDKIYAFFEEVRAFFFSPFEVFVSVYISVMTLQFIIDI